ncbi:MAG: hypothetical protein J0L55_15440 [Caulobacterales bacterium]|jgi:hypothetical protein|nr:hypothetical protein [Caulobacterales bacterium]
MNDTIDHTTLSELIVAGAIANAHIVGQPGGWSVSVNYGKAHRVLRAQRTKQVRLFKKMDSLVEYLKGVGISHFDVDASSYKPEPKSRPDRSESLRKTHEAAAHDKWFREQVEEGLKLARSPDAVWIDHEDVKVMLAQKKAEILAKVQGI